MLQATLYIRPNAHSRTIEISEIEADDEQYLKDNNVVVSLEEVPPALISVYGSFTIDGESKEALVLRPLKTACKEVMKELVEQIKTMKGNVNEEQ